MVNMSFPQLNFKHHVLQVVKFYTVVKKNFKTDVLEYSLSSEWMPTAIYSKCDSLEDVVSKHFGV